MIQVIADSTCDIAEELRKGYDLITLPLVITAEGKEYLDGVDLKTQQVYELMQRGILPGTAQIPYDVIHGAFEDCCKKGNDFLYITFSGKMSGCFSFANVVAEELGEEYPKRRMELVDSKGGSGATGLIVLQALKMAKAESTMEEILAQVRFMVEHVEHIFTIADLSWMVKGGRINKPLGFVGSVLNIRPWLDVEDGKMVVRGMVRGEKKAISTVAQEAIRRARKFQTQLIAITHAGDAEAAKKIEKLLKEALPACRTAVSQIGGVLGVHLGMGGIGVFFFNERPPEYRL